MTKLTASLLALLALSLAGNVLALARPRPIVASPRVHAARVAPSPEPPWVAPPHAQAAAEELIAAPRPTEQTPRASSRIAEVEECAAFFARLRRLGAIGGEEYQELAYELTAEFLGIDEAAIRAAAERMWAEWDQATEQSNEARRALPPKKGDIPWTEADTLKAEEIDAQARRAGEEAMGNIRRLLTPDSSRRHARFAPMIELWSQMVRSPDSSGAPWNE